eukprot:7883617-Heterocapsa_arctica.AAC.1
MRECEKGEKDGSQCCQPGAQPCGPEAHKHCARPAQPSARQGDTRHPLRRARCERRGREGRANLCALRVYKRLAKGRNALPLGDPGAPAMLGRRTLAAAFMQVST